MCRYLSSTETIYLYSWKQKYPGFFHSHFCDLHAPQQKLKKQRDRGPKGKMFPQLPGTHWTRRTPRKRSHLLLMPFAIRGYCCCSARAAPSELFFFYVNWVCFLLLPQTSGVTQRLSAWQQTTATCFKSFKLF